MLSLSCRAAHWQRRETVTEPINMMHSIRADSAQWGDDMLETHSVTVALGAEVSGLDLGGAVSEADIDSIHEALMQHQVLFSRSVTRSAGCWHWQSAWARLMLGILFIRMRRDIRMLSS